MPGVAALALICLTGVTVPDPGRPCAVAALRVAVADGAAPLPPVDSRAPARRRPLSLLALSDFLETIVRAQAFDRFCPALFSRDQKAAIYLAYRWGKSVATSDAYPASLFLNIISTKADYMRLIGKQDCTDPRLARTRADYDAFLRRNLPTLRMSEIR